jgi:hypothetical protein
MSAMGSGWLSSCELFQIEGPAMNAGELAVTGSAQPITQPMTAIQNETTVASPLFAVPNVERIPGRIIRFQPLNRCDDRHVFK